MIQLICGGSGSGKSRIAENYANQPRFHKRLYIATMRALDDEAFQRVLRHRTQRDQMKFVTCEFAYVKDFTYEPADVVLLEDLTNLFMNEWFSEGQAGAGARVFEAIMKLEASCKTLIIVTNDILSDGVVYDEELEAYLEALSSLTMRLANEADMVHEVTAGIDRIVKKEAESTEDVCSQNVHSVQHGMTFVFGGRYQGKLSYAQSLASQLHGIAPEDVVSVDNLDDARNAHIFLNFEHWLRQASGDIYEQIDGLVAVNPCVIVVCADMSCGITPLKREERTWRELVGRVSCAMTKRAALVVRLQAGIPLVLKGGNSCSVT